MTENIGIPHQTEIHGPTHDPPAISGRRAPSNAGVFKLPRGVALLILHLGRASFLLSRNRFWTLSQMTRLGCRFSHRGMLSVCGTPAAPTPGANVMQPPGQQHLQAMHH
jgi:hypothetical protein